MTSPNKDLWLTVEHLVEHLAKRRRYNDVRVMINGCPVPIIEARYMPVSDMVELFLDEESEEYKIATGI